MAIPKKGSRTITVDGVEYRWRVRSRPTYSQALAQSPLSFAVELEAEGQSTLTVRTGATRPDSWIMPSQSLVTSASVERAIRQALAQGWNPQEAGNAHAITDFALEI